MTKFMSCTVTTTLNNAQSVQKSTLEILTFYLSLCVNYLNALEPVPAPLKPPFELVPDFGFVLDDFLGALD